MQYLFSGINSIWWWLGSCVLAGLVALFVYVMWDLVKQEIRWWRKSREYRRYVEESDED